MRDLVITFLLGSSFHSSHIISHQRPKSWCRKAHIASIFPSKVIDGTRDNLLYIFSHPRFICRRSHFPRFSARSENSTASIYLKNKTIVYRFQFRKSDICACTLKRRIHTRIPQRRPDAKMERYEMKVAANRTDSRMYDPNLQFTKCEKIKSRFFEKRARSDLSDLYEISFPIWRHFCSYDVLHSGCPTKRLF